MAPEQQARVGIDTLLSAAGWHVCNVADANIHAATLTGVELQSGRYAQGMPTKLPAWRRPLPFVWESTGIKTISSTGWTRSRASAPFSPYSPRVAGAVVSLSAACRSTTAVNETPGTFLTRMRAKPKLVTQWGSGGASYSLWPVQLSAITNLEKSLAANKPKALTQMSTGSGKTFTSIGFIYRLIKFGGARRVLFLVDRGNLAGQTKKELDAYASPLQQLQVWRGIHRPAPAGHPA